MKFPFSMLLDYVRTSMTALEVGDLLTMAGLELEGIEEVEGEPVLEIKVCSNRGDGLSVLGVAREVLAKRDDASPTDLYERVLIPNRFGDEGKPSELAAPVKIETEDCTRFGYRGFRNVHNGEAPEVIRKRLRQAGMRPISLFVDLTNYVMLEIGQPLHAYDVKKLNGPEIVVRQARAGEKLKTLNGDEHELRTDQMMICDGAGPVGVAGVMGGEATEVDDSTREVLLEAAHFVNTSVRRTRKQLKLNTEASYRFERSVDPELVAAGLNRVRELLEDMGHGDWVVPGLTDVRATTLVKPTLKLRLARAETLLGMAITEEEAKRYLRRLGFSVTSDGSVLTVEVPTWRFDIEREEDLIEELGRVHGYEKIPEVLPEGHTPQGGVFGRYLLEEKLIGEALRLGFDQAMSHSLRGDSPLDDSRAPKIKVRTPGSPDTATLRNSLLPGLADASRRNGVQGVHLVELGPIFSDEPIRFSTHKSVALISCGPLWPANRQNEPEARADFYSVKAALDALAEVAGEVLVYTPDGEDPRFHPTRQAKIQSESWTGRIGQIHPQVAEAAGLPADVALAEVALGPDWQETPVHFHSVSRNPSVRRDIAFLIDKATPYAEVEAAIETALGETLESLWLFDIYEGKGVPEGQHSLAVALTLRKAGANFTDEEANQEREKAVEALAALGATRR